MTGDLNLKQIIWDYNISEQELTQLLNHKVSHINGFALKNLYLRMIMSYSWHTLVKNLSREQLKEALDDEVIKSVFPKKLQGKFQYVKKFL